MTNQEIVKAVEQYVQASSGLRGAPTMQTRRVIKALRLIGIERSGFRVRCETDKEGVYGPAIGSVYSCESCAQIIKNADLLIQCGLSVWVSSRTPGRESAFVSTPRSDQRPHLVMLCSVGSPG